MTNINELGEFKLIEELTNGIDLQQCSTVAGVGDDCAVMDYNNDLLTVATTDMLLEGIHFDLIYTPLRYLGYKAAMANISDICAMNALPTQMLISIGVSAKFSVEGLQELYEGIYQACEKAGVDVVGGDTCSSLTGLTISITCLGQVERDRVVYRSGAMPNDLICVTGDLGAAYMGLQLLEREKRVFNEVKDPNFKPDFSNNKYVLQRQLHPEACIDTIHYLRQNDIIPTAMMDISDGLSSELMHICKESNVGCRVYEDKIPIDFQTAEMATELHMNLTTVALNGGEDYELLFTVPLDMHDKISKLEGITVIGYCTEPSEKGALITRDGQLIELKAQGWNAFPKS